MSELAPSATPDAERPQLVFFYDDRSGIARRVEGFLAQVLQRRRNHGTFRIQRVDVRRRPELAERFGVDGGPTLVVITERKVAARLDRPRGCGEIELFLKPWLR
jgi:thioredoxin-like negative regulator of GroEL